MIHRDSNTYIKDNMTLDNISYETMKTPAIFALTSYGKNKKQTIKRAWTCLRVLS